MQESSIGRYAIDVPLPPDLVDRVVERVLAFAPEPQAVLVTGSYARGQATESSDLDLSALYSGPVDEAYRTWFEARGERPLHVSAGIHSLESWLARGAEQATWSLGFPTEEAALYLWASDQALVALGNPPFVRRPAGEPELEDFVETAVKVRTSVERGDWRGVRWYAHDLGTRAPATLIALSPERRVTDYRDVLEAALGLSVAPSHYRHDLEVCLGLAQANDQHVAAAARRLALEILAFLRERAPNVDSQPWVSRYLADGTLERHFSG